MGLWVSAEPLVLASKSAARRAVLEAAGIPITIAPADINERAIEARADPRDAGAAALLLACEKAKVISERMGGRLVLGADQTLALEQKRFTKPKNRDSAKEQLLSLSGHTHHLFSAVAAARDGTVVFRHVEVAKLTMRPLSEAFINSYLDTVGAAATQSVGGYQLETIGIHLFERIEGDHFTILGMPLFALLAFLRQEGCLVG